MTKETLLKYREIYKKQGKLEKLAKVEKILKTLGVDASETDSKENKRGK